MSLSFNTPNVVLKSMLVDRSPLNIASLNVQSLVPNIDEIRHIFNGASVDILCFSETFLNQNIPNSVLAIKGYNIFRKDRAVPPLNYGGLCMFVGNHIKARLVTIPSSISELLVSDLEFLFLNVFINGRKILFGTVYNPPKTNKRSYAQFKKSLVDLESLFSYFSCRFDEIYISGDFNFDILQNSTFSRDYLNLLKSLNLSVHNTVAPTFCCPTASGASYSLIDHIISFTNNSICFFNQLSLGIGSHHDLLVFSVNYYSPPKPSYFSFRDFSSIDDSRLYTVCNSVPWEDIFFLSSASSQIEFFNSYISLVFDSCVPLKKVTLRAKSPPWLSQEISNAISVRMSKYRLWKRYPNSQSHLEYKQARNIVVGLIRIAKRNFFKDKLDPSLPPKVFWRNVRNLGLGRCKSSISGVFKPDDINSYFCSSLNSSSSTVDLISNVSPNSFSFSNISLEELHSAIWKVKSESAGLDNISLKFVKRVFPFVSKYLLHIFNFMLTSSSYPDQWKLSKIIPIPKISNPSELSHFRPISILSSLSKAFEIVVKNQIQSHLNSNSLVSFVQSGFRKFHSTSTALLNVCDDIRRNMSNRELTSLTLLDFSKAFDSINHRILFNKLLSQFRFSISAAKLIFNYLSNRSQAVFFDNSLSNFLPVISGVPQGSVLGPLLFSMYINDIESSIHNCSFHIFADDVQIYRNSRLDQDSILRNISLINDDLSSIVRWSVSNGLVLNANKSQSIVIYKKSLDTSSFPGIFLHGSLIPYSNTVRDLGLVFNKTLTWGDHLVSISKRVFGMLSCLYKVVGFSDSQFKKKMFLSYLLPHFIYGDIVLFGLLQENMNILQRCFNACTRFIFGIRKFDHISAYSSIVLGCSLSIFYEFRVCLFIFKLLKTKQPFYLYRKLLFSRFHSTNLRLIPAKNCCRSLNKSFFVRGVSLWNSIPLQIKKLGSVKLFKSKFLEWRG